MLRTAIKTMNAMQWAEYLKKRYTLVNPPMNMRIKFEDGDWPFGGTITGHATPSRYGSVRLSICMTVPDRDTGEPFEAHSIYNITIGDLEAMPLDAIDDMVNRYIRNVFIHEADECFHVNGVRKFDPHARESIYSPLDGPVADGVNPNR